MKAHLGVGAETGLTHTVVTAPANEHDVTRASQPPHGGGSRLGGIPGTREWRSGRRVGTDR